MTHREAEMAVKANVVQSGPVSAELCGRPPCGLTLYDLSLTLRSIWQQSVIGDYLARFKVAGSGKGVVRGFFFSLFSFSFFWGVCVCVWWLLLLSCFLFPFSFSFSFFS